MILLSKYMKLKNNSQQIHTLQIQVIHSIINIYNSWWKCPRPLLGYIFLFFSFPYKTSVCAIYENDKTLS